MNEETFAHKELIRFWRVSNFRPTITLFRSTLFHSFNTLFILLDGERTKKKTLQTNA